MSFAAPKNLVLGTGLKPLSPTFWHCSYGALRRQLSRLEVIPVVTLIVIHDRNDVIEPTDALELTAGVRWLMLLLAEVGYFSLFFEK